LSQDPSRLIRVGRVAGAFGVKGEVKITAFTDKAKTLLDYGELVREDGSPGLTLLSGRAQKNEVVARARQVATREEAEALRGLHLYVSRDRLPEPEEDEFYLADLIGLAAVSPAGEPLGVVLQVRDFGAGDVLEIKPEAGPSWFVAFTLSAVPEVRLAAGQIVVDRPPETSEREV
jgi:16S rRNA processing protein RimM